MTKFLQASIVLWAGIFFMDIVVCQQVNIYNQHSPNTQHAPNIAHAPTVYCPACLTTWEYPPRNKKKEFVLRAIPASFYEAIHNCRREGMQLAVVDGAGENHDAYLLARSIGKSIWIGAEVIGNGGDWIWVTTLLNVGWFNFAHGEPNDLNHYEGCMEINAQGSWADQCCITAKPYLCERYV